MTITRWQKQQQPLHTDFPTSNFFKLENSSKILKLYFTATQSTLRLESLNSTSHSPLIVMNTLVSSCPSQRHQTYQIRDITHNQTSCICDLRETVVSLSNETGLFIQEKVKISFPSLDLPSIHNKVISALNKGQIVWSEC